MDTTWAVTQNEKGGCWRVELATVVSNFCLLC